MHSLRKTRFLFKSLYKWKLSQANTFKKVIAIAKLSFLYKFTY
jgi:hypothetical protein